MPPPSDFASFTGRDPIGIGGGVMLVDGAVYHPCRPAAVNSEEGLMEARDIALTALHVLSGWSHGHSLESDDVKMLRTHALPDEVELPTDELACRIVGRTCRQVIQESKGDRRHIRLKPARQLKKVG